MTLESHESYWCEPTLGLLEMSTTLNSATITFRLFKGYVLQEHPDITRVRQDTKDDQLTLRFVEKGKQLVWVDTKHILEDSWSKPIQGEDWVRLCTAR